LSQDAFEADRFEVCGRLLMMTAAEKTPRTVRSADEQHGLFAIPHMPAGKNAEMGSIFHSRAAFFL
jgi:hypothetical protein